MKLIYPVLVFIVGMTLDTVAQQTTLTSGEVATGSTGNFSYSIGQVSYNSYSSSSGQLSEGVQQAFEVYSLGVEEPITAFSLAIYPNPTSKFISMDFKNQFEEGYHFKLFDLQGKLLIDQNVHNQNTKIDLRDFASSTYILSLFKNNSRIQSFKILKH
jgi:hypothetical protein